MKPSPSDQRLAMVREFHTTFKVPLPRTFEDIDNSAALARRTLQVEEFEEYMAADVGVDMLDALVDMEYITCGTQLVLGLPIVHFEDVPLTIYACQQQLADELNKSQLCQRGLKNTTARLRSVIAKIAEDNMFKFHEAFTVVHEANMKKQWTGDETKLAKEGSVITPSVNPGLFIVKRADGKIMKPPTFVHPVLKRYV